MAAPGEMELRKASLTSAAVRTRRGVPAGVLSLVSELLLVPGGVGNAVAADCVTAVLRRGTGGAPSATTLPAPAPVCAPPLLFPGGESSLLDDCPLPEEGGEAVATEEPAPWPSCASAAGPRCGAWLLSAGAGARGVAGAGAPPDAAGHASGAGAVVS